MVDSLCEIWHTKQFLFIITKTRRKITTGKPPVLPRFLSLSKYPTAVFQWGNVYEAAYGILRHHEIYAMAAKMSNYFGPGHFPEKT